MVLQREGSFLDKAALKLPPTFTSKGLFHDIENDLVAAGGEFIGTVLFLLFGLGASQSVGNILDQYSETKTDTSAAARIICNFYAAAAFGLTLYSTATIFYRFTGSIFNPSISLALLIVGAIKPTRFVLVCIAQMVGGIVANGILFSLSPGPLMVDLKLGSGISATQGCFIEMFTTANLVLSVLMLSAEKHLLTPHAPLAFAFTLFAMMLYSIEYTGTGMNTARAFGTACLSGFPSHHWIYWVGPTLGALLATAFYMLLKSVHYWDINPGQDSTAPLEAHNHQDEEIGRGHLEPATTEEGLERMANREA